MEKQTFSIPDGCKTVTVEQVGNKIITTFEPEKYVPKVGDCVKMECPAGYVFFCCCGFDSANNPISGHYIARGILFTDTDVELGVGFKLSYFKNVTQITPSELQSEFNKLGYEYDFKTHTAKKLRWKPKVGEKYYFVNHIGQISVFHFASDTLDLKMIDFGNCFKTEEEAEKFRDYIKAYKP